MAMTAGKDHPRPGRVHFIGICGTAMAALACMMHQRGWQVSGSDAGCYPPMSDILAARQIVVQPGYEASRIVPELQLVVVGNVASRDNVEVVRMRELGLPHGSLPEILWNEFLRSTPVRVVVAGTHGKTTTASLAAWVLEAAGCRPSFLIGGELRNFSANCQLGAGEFFVLEGDEYNAAFFDRAAKFHHYRPTHLLLTGLEMDHADIFSGVEAIAAEFSRLLRALPPTGLVVANADCPRLADLLAASPCPVIRYGEGAAASYRLTACEPREAGTRLTVVDPQGETFTLATATIGRHNALNCLAVYLLSRRLGLPGAAVAAALESFAGVKRRQEVIKRWRQTIFISDFAHHPTAIAKTLAARKKPHSGSRLGVVFEPRTPTNRRRLFQEQLPAAFAAADEIIIAPVYRGEQLPDDERLDVEQLVADLRRRGQEARLGKSAAGIFAWLTTGAAAATPRLVVVMSTGDFAGLYDRISSLPASTGH